MNETTDKRPTVLVCGGRNYSNRGLVFKTLDEIGPKAVVHGACGVDADDPYWLDMKGADDIADDWACRRGVEKHRRPAAWKRLGRKAGPIRNQQMLDEFAGRIALVVAFPGESGTADMVRRAKKAGIRVIEVTK